MRTHQRWNKQKTNNRMIDVNVTIAIFILKRNGLNTSNKCARCCAKFFGGLSHLILRNKPMRRECCSYAILQMSGEIVLFSFLFVRGNQQAQTLKNQKSPLSPEDNALPVIDYISQFSDIIIFYHMHSTYFFRWINAHPMQNQKSYWFIYL